MGTDPPAGWPHRDASRLCQVQGLRWHVQHWPGGPGTAMASAPDPMGNAGAKRPIALLLHGTGASSHSWRHLAPLLAQHFEVLAPDLPGHGFTLTPDGQDLSLPGVAQALRDLLAPWGRQPQLLVGHSAGAAVACRLVLDGMPTVRTVVAINGALLPLRGAAGQLFLPMARLLSANPLVAPAFSRWAAGPRTTQRLLQSTGSRIDSAGQRCYEQLVAMPRHTAGALRLMASWDLRPLQRDLHRLPTPLHLIVGEGDRTLSPAHADRVRQLLPHAPLHRLAGCGHLAHEENAEAVAAVCERAWAAPSVDTETTRSAAGGMGEACDPAGGRTVSPARPTPPRRQARA